MTESGQGPEPTIGDVLAAIAALTVKVDRIAARGEQTYAEVIAVKANQAFDELHSTDQQTAIARHIADPHAHDRAA